MRRFQASFRAECGTALQIVEIEADDLRDALIGLIEEWIFDADAVAMTIDEVRA